MANSITIDGVLRDFKSYGLLINSYENELNMPSRIGSVFYNWGDEIQPLVQEQDIHWNSNLIKVSCVHDVRYGVGLEQTLVDLRSTKECILTTDFGVYNVVLIGVEKVVDKTTGINTLIVTFEQEVTDFSNIVLPTNPNGGGTGFKVSETTEDNADVYDFFKDFGILVTRTESFNDIPEYDKLNATRYQKPKLRADVRKWGRVRIHCALPFNKANVNYVRKIFSSPELKKVYYRGFSYDAFLSRGFSVKHERDAVYFNIDLNISVRDSILQVWGNNIYIPPNDTSPSLADGTNFGLVDLLGESKTQQFEIRNLSTNPLTDLSLVVEGASFEAANNPPSSIGGSGNGFFSVRCDPVELKTQYGIVKVYSSDLLYSPYIFHVSCSVWDSTLVGALLVTGNGITIPASGHVANVADGTDLGEVVQLTRASVTIQLTNTGTKKLEFVSAEITSTLGSWNLDTTLPSGLNIGNSVGVTTSSIAPLAPNDRNGQLTITWNNGRDAGNITHVINFTLQSIVDVDYPDIEVSYQGTLIPYNATAQTQYGTLFPAQEVFTDATVRSFTIVNKDPLPIIDIKSNSQHFIVPDKGVLPLTGSSEFTVGFLPVVEGNPLNGELQISTTQKTWRCNLQGEGLGELPNTQIRLLWRGKEISLFSNVPSTLNGTDFGIVGTDDFMVTREYTIQNIGNQPITLNGNDITLTGTPGFAVYQNTVAMVLLPYNSVNFIISYTPQGLTGLAFYDRMGLAVSSVGFLVNIKVEEEEGINPV